MSKELFGTTGLLTMVAAFGVVLLGTLLPHGALQTSVEQNNPLAPLTMAAVGTAIYSTPMLIMSQLGMMFSHANSPGAAFCLLILGAGLNLATILWIALVYGWRQTAVWFASLLTIVLICAYVVDKPLIPKGVEPAGHTHAFDVYTNPFHQSQKIDFDSVKNILLETGDFSTSFSLKSLAALLLIGLVLTVMGSDNRIESWIFAKNEVAIEGKGLSRNVSPTVVGFVCLGGLVALSIYGCYAYYPPPREVLKEMQNAKGEVLSAALTEDIEVALTWLPIWEDWSRKLEVGTYLRKYELRPYQRMQTFLLRKQLELLEHELEHLKSDREAGAGHDHHHSVESAEAIKLLVGRLSLTSLRVSEAYRN